MNALPKKQMPNTNVSQFSLKRIKILAKSNIFIILMIAGTVILLNTVQALVEVPLYVSTSKLQVQAFEASRGIDEKAAASSEVINDGMRLSNAVLVFQSKVFLNELAKDLLASPDRDRIVMSWGIGRKLKMSYALYRLGLASIQYQRIDLKSLTTDELGILLSSMISVNPIASDQTIEIKVSALEDWTAYKINQSALTAFARANKLLDQDEFDRAIEYLNTQVDTAQDSLKVAEEDLANYLKEHLNVSTESSSTTFLNEYLLQRNKRKEIENEITANRQLISSLKQKLKSQENKEESIGEVLEALKEELLQLKYQKAKLLEQNYSIDNPGVLTLDRKIESAQEFIQHSEKSNTIDAKDIMGSGEYRKSLASKVLQTQELLAKQEIELKGINEHLRGIETDVNNLPEDGMTASALRREVARAADLHGELLKRLELMRVRSQATKNSLRVVTSPNEINAPIQIPFLPRFIFGILAGFLLGLSAVMLMDMLSPRIAIRSDVESSGFNYAGKFSGTIDSCTEVLASMECIFKKRGPEESIPVVLCSSASPALTLHTFLPLIDFMAARNEKVLLIAEDDTLIAEKYHTTRTIEGVQTYSYPGGNKDLIQLKGAHSFGVIQILLDEYVSSYAAIFLFVSRGSESSAYSLCRNLADRILIIGEEGAHTLDHYRSLSAGFHHPEKVYMALLPDQGSHIKFLRSKFKQMVMRRKNNPSVSPTV